MAKEWLSFTNQKQWEAYLKRLVKTNDKALKRAILLIYENQTEDERYYGKTKIENKIGFSKIDAEEMTRIALKIKQNRELTEGELAKSRNKMGKYWKQLMVISKAKIKQEEEIAATTILNESDAKTDESVQDCEENNKSCYYGICDECKRFKNVKELSIVIKYMR